MATVIDFRDSAMASLRRRVARVEEANHDILAFARGHSGVAAAVHAAVLAAIEAEGREALLHTVAQVWPDMLGVDAIVLAIASEDGALRVDHAGTQPIERAIVEQAAGALHGVVLRGVARGHALFGPASDLVRAEALIPLGGDGGAQVGVLALGQRDAGAFATWPGGEPLRFLGDALMRTMARCPAG